MKKKIIIVGPGPQFIGGIAEFIGGLLNSDLKDDYDMILFDSLQLKQRKRIKTRTKLNPAEIWRTIKVLQLHFLCLLKHPGASVHINSSCFWGFYEKLVMLLQAKILGRKVYFHLHGGEFISFFTKHRLRRLFRALLSKADRIISVSREISEVIDLPDKAVVIANGIPVPPKEILEKEKNEFFSFVSISVLGYRKRIDLVLQACRILKERGYSNFKFLFAGKGPTKDDLEKYIKDNNLQDVVEYKGVVRGKEKEHLYSSSHVFISTSQAESFGISIAEAMSYGLGMISTPTGIATYCFKQNNGALIKINDLDSLVKAMEDYLKGKYDLSVQKEINYNFIKNNFSWEIVASNIGQIYSGK